MLFIRCISVALSARVCVCVEAIAAWVNHSLELLGILHNIIIHSRKRAQNTLPCSKLWATSNTATHTHAATMTMKNCWGYKCNRGAKIGFCFGLNASALSLVDLIYNHNGWNDIPQCVPHNGLRFIPDHPPASSALHWKQSRLPTA